MDEPVLRALATRLTGLLLEGRLLVARLERPNSSGSSASRRMLWEMDLARDGFDAMEEDEVRRERTSEDTRRVS